MTVHDGFSHLRERFIRLPAPYAFIAGAGPGSLRYLTTEVYALLTSGAADTVIHDRLIGEDILALIPEGTKRVYAGKKAGDHALSQPEINAALVSEARRGKKVLRLKGGDPFIFGRGGEETAALRAADIPFEVLPGVTAATAAAALCAVPLTHRDASPAVRFVTGHAREGEAPALFPPGNTADPGDTLVIYMGAARITAVRDELIAKGLPGDTPCAVISRAGMEGGRVLRTILQRLPEDMKNAAMPSPCIVIAGKNTGLGNL